VSQVVFFDRAVRPEAGEKDLPWQQMAVIFYEEAKRIEEFWPKFDGLAIAKQEPLARFQTIGAELKNLIVWLRHGG